MKNKKCFCGSKKDLEKVYAPKHPSNNNEFIYFCGVCAANNSMIQFNDELDVNDPERLFHKSWINN